MKEVYFLDLATIARVSSISDATVWLVCVLNLEVAIRAAVVA